MSGFGSNLARIDSKLLTLKSTPTTLENLRAAASMNVPRPKPKSSSVFCEKSPHCDSNESNHLVVARHLMLDEVQIGCGHSVELLRTCLVFCLRVSFERKCRFRVLYC